MVLRKCPGCKNTVSNASRWCPICGLDFRGRLIKRILTLLILIGAAAWAAQRFLHLRIPFISG